jgi:hypothetical protein
MALHLEPAFWRETLAPYAVPDVRRLNSTCSRSLLDQHTR